MTAATAPTGGITPRVALPRRAASEVRGPFAPTAPRRNVRAGSPQDLLAGPNEMSRASRYLRSPI
jgi:hypothetical protein